MDADWSAARALCRGLAQVWHGELVAEVGDLGADALAGLVAAGGVEDVVDQVGDVLHLRFGEAAGGDGG